MTTTHAPRARWTVILRWWAAARLTIARFVEPTACGLPRWPLQLWFPALLVLLLAVATAFGVSGSSTGLLWIFVGSGADPDLLYNAPQAIRSDEWLTQMMWIVSQATQGYPAVNHALPGGMDATVLLSLPAWDWPTIFRPDAAGFMIFGLDHGLAIRWWLPGFAMTAACYSMLIGLLPRRPFSCAAIATSVLFWPMIQWWYLPSITWPAALCFLSIAAAVFSLRDPRLWVRIGWSTVTGYVAVCAALTLYPPFLLPAVLVASVIIAGMLLAATAGKEPDGIGLRAALVRMAPLLLAMLAAGAVLAVFFVSRSATIAAINDTVYPGQRLQSTGAATSADLVGTFSGLFSGGMDAAQSYSGLLGPNASEASAPILLGLFLLIPVAYFVVRDWIVLRRVQWVMLAALACSAVLLAYLLLPGWDALAHLVLLDRTTVTRSRLGLGLLGVVAIGLLVRRLDESDTRLPWWASGATVAAAVAAILLVHSALADVGDQALTGANHLRAVAAMFVTAAFLFTRRRWVGVASTLLLAVSLVLTIGVNPLYRGALDLAETALGQEVTSVDEESAGTWVAVGSQTLGAVLVESGVTSYSGVQLYPSRDLWEDIDPTGSAIDVWNRYASLRWEPGSGEPTLSNPYPDVVTATFDSCSAFAMTRVTYVLTDQVLDQPCLDVVSAGQQGATSYWIYRIQR